MHESNHQRKLESDTTTLGLIWPGVSLVQSDLKILWSAVSLKQINWYLSFSYMELVIKGSMRDLLLFGCGQLGFRSSQIAGFFDHQFLWKNAIVILIFLHEVTHQGEVAPKTTIFGWLRSVVSLLQSDCRVFWSAISLERSSQYHWYFAWRYSSRKGGQVCLWSNGIPGFFDQQYLCKESIDTFA